MSQDSKLNCDLSADSSSIMVENIGQRKFLTKKRVISAIIIILVAAIVVTGIIVGIWIFTENNKLIMKYKIDLIEADNSKLTQDVSTDADENIVQFHLTKGDKEWWIINDYNRNIRIAKIKEANGNSNAICLLSSVDLSNIKKPSTVKDSNLEEVRMDEALSETETRTIASAPVSDRSIIGKTAKTLCKGTDIYWTYSICENNSTAKLDAPARQKRGVTAPCACYRYYYNIPCRAIYWFHFWYNGYHYCHWYWFNCYGTVYYYYCSTN